jgi:D-glycero-D-manno-heptose 1,7-bisphosphate phosphatase
MASGTERPRVRHLILDRDGVLNREDPSGGWIARPDDWGWEDGALEGLRLARAADLRVSVATNQSGIGRGIVEPLQVEAVHSRMLREASADGGRIDAVFMCPHAPEAGCLCRKPAPGLVLNAVEASGIAAADTVVVGDAARDLESARAAGVRFALVRTGKGRATELELAGVEAPVFDDLRDAVTALVSEG